MSRVTSARLPTTRLSDSLSTQHSALSTPLSPPRPRTLAALLGAGRARRRATIVADRALARLAQVRALRLPLLVGCQFAGVIAHEIDDSEDGDDQDGRDRDPEPQPDADVLQPHHLEGEGDERG